MSASAAPFSENERMHDGQGMKLTFIGGGNMAAALIAGLAGQMTPGENIHVVDPNPAQLERLADGFGVSTAPASAGGAAGE